MQAIRPQNSQATSLKTPLLALKASAGSGKTFALATRYIILLFQGARAYEILAITFTRKATKEMQDRIQNALYDLARDVRGAFYQSLLAEGFSAQEIAQNAPRIYRTFLHDRTRILTIDAFFTTILRKFSYFVGLRADFTMIDDGQSAQKTIKEQFLESNARDSSAKILAKTCRELGLEFDRLFSFIQNGFEDRLHFSDAVLRRYGQLDIGKLLAHSRDNENRVVELLQDMRQKLIDAGDRMGTPLSDSGYNTLNCADFGEFLAKDVSWLVKSEPKEYRYFSKILKHDAALNAQMCAMIEEVKQCMGEIFASREGATLSHIARMIARYALAHKRVLASSNMLGFSDCMLELYGLLAQGVGSYADCHRGDSRVGSMDSRLVIDPLFFYFRLDTTIAHILIDEFQDTSPMQYRILEPLINEICAGFGAHGREHRSFFIVGDSKQSIYGFRGSEGGFFDKVAGKLGLSVQNLPYNYRSYSEIVGFVNAVFAEIFHDYIPQILPSQSDKVGGFVRVCSLRIHSKQSGKRTANKQEVGAALLAYATDTLGELLESGVDAQDIAFLCFKNTEAQDLRNAIKARFPHINIVLEARAKITDEKSVKALMCALELAYYLHRKSLESSKILHDDVARFYLYKLTKLLGGKVCSGADLSRLAQIFMQALDTCASAIRPSRYLLAFMQAFGLGDKSAQLLLQHSIESSSIEEFFTLLKTRIPDAPKDNQQGLRILTIHASKGLEFPYVMLLDRFSAKKPNDALPIIHTQDGQILLHLQALHKRRQELDKTYKQASDLRTTQATMEKNNVLYVACTRAQKGLIIIAKSDQSSFSPIIDHLPRESTHTPTDTSTTSASSTHNRAQGDLLATSHTTQDPPYEAEILLESGSIIASPSIKPKPITSPTILTQEHFGRQESYTTQVQDGFMLDIASMRFGEALHLGLEYRLGFGVGLEQIGKILGYKFGLDSSALEDIHSRIYALENDREFSALLECAQGGKGVDRGVYVEVPLFINDTLMRLDMLVHYVLGAREIWIVIDYKSGMPRAEHIGQVQAYMQALYHAYGSEMEYRGYVAYIRDSIQIVRVP